jgi:hypothetical protein
LSSEIVLRDTLSSMIVRLERSTEATRISLSRAPAARLAVPCLAVVVLVFLIGTALHSLHHLSDDHRTTPCQWPVCGAGHPVTADSQSTTVQPLLVTTGLLVKVQSESPRLSPLHARHERAPPRTR